MADGTQIDPLTRFLGTQSCAPQVGSLSYFAPACSRCQGSGQVGDGALLREEEPVPCSCCEGTGWRSMSDDEIESLLAIAVKAEDIALVVACESALTMIQSEDTRRAAVARVAELVSARTQEAA